MSQYSRYTTPKGQLLLNIKPPSSRITQNNANNNGGASVTVPIYDSQYVPYTANYNNVQNRNQGQVYGNPGYYQEQRIQPGYSVQNQRQIIYPASRNQVAHYSINNANSNIHYQPRSRIQYTQQPTYYNSSHISYNTAPQPQPTFIMNPSQNEPQINNKIHVQQPKVDIKNVGRFGQIQYKNKNKRDKGQVDPTVCCFPGYWLLILLLAFVVGCFFLITARSNQGIFNVPTNNTETANGTSTVNVNINTNGPNKLSPSSNTEKNKPNSSSPGDSASSTSTSKNTTKISKANSTSTSTSSSQNSNTSASQTFYQFGPPSTSSQPSTSISNTNANTNPSSNIQYQSYNPTTSFMFPPKTHHQLRHHLFQQQKQNSHKLSSQITVNSHII